MLAGAVSTGTSAGAKRGADEGGVSEAGEAVEEADAAAPDSSADGQDAVVS